MAPRWEPEEPILILIEKTSRQARKDRKEGKETWMDRMLGHRSD